MLGHVAASFSIAGLIVLAGSSEFPLVAAPTGQGAGPGRSELPFTLHRGFLIVVEGQIGEVSGLTFIVDTGTSRTVLDTRVAHALGLRGPRSQLFSSNSSMAAEEIVVPSIRFGPIGVVSPRILSADLAVAFGALEIKADGIVGADVLRGTCSASITAPDDSSSGLEDGGRRACRSNPRRHTLSSRWWWIPRRFG